MSFKVQPQSPAIPNRCQLFGPGSRPAIFEKMAASAADVINLDLEDSVSPSDKDNARKNVIEAINDIERRAVIAPLFAEIEDHIDAAIAAEVVAAN